MTKIDLDFDLPMASWCDEVQQNVYTVISEARITLDPRLLSKDIIVLPLKVADNFREAIHDQCVWVELADRRGTYLASLSI
jgi:hypothetical protein